MIVPAGFVPPPKPYVCKVTSDVDASVRVTSNVALGSASVPTYDVPSAMATSAQSRVTRQSAKTWCFFMVCLAQNRGCEDDTTVGRDLCLLLGDPVQPESLAVPSDS